MFELGDLVQMKKPHACGENRWEVVRLGADIKIRCMGCGHLVMLTRRDFTKKMKKLLKSAAEVDPAEEKEYLTVDEIKRPR
ncbi:hypothetical protein LCO01nite_03380 [Lapidilactobacillus concavus]|uniref:DUF951 domain-containing protein n=1 Tax=Lapidilactobacillus concavus TaxID=287844 RepID=UPI00070CF60A|nr:DUF951 domain-containing protein [Lapidilactobacillus concavus]MCH4056384.1 DUF951 domain-containing protein [Lactobacillaceae bacterium]GEL12789.1 hypothetical protein LCO01nite_03380 [Lapidilactobacillus concavus]